MPIFAVIDNQNIVTNMIVAETKEDAENATNMICIESDSAFIGSLYNTETQTFLNLNQIESSN